MIKHDCYVLQTEKKRLKKIKSYRKYKCNARLAYVPSGVCVWSRSSLLFPALAAKKIRSTLLDYRKMYAAAAESSCN